MSCDIFCDPVCAHVSLGKCGGLRAFLRTRLRASYGKYSMRRAAKIDRNQPEIVAALRAIGADVFSLAAVGSGIPDLLVGFRGETFLIEVKDGTKPKSARQLTDDQIQWHAAWRGGRCVVVHDVTEALAALRVA